MKTKKCYTCKGLYLLEEYPINNGNKDGRHHDCKRCKNVKNRGAYRNKDKMQRYNKEAHQKRKDRYYSILDSYSDKMCSKCGYSSDVWAPFDWHHTDVENKLYELSSMVRHTEENIVAELDKCILLCSNCHRLHHYLEK